MNKKIAADINQEEVNLLTKKLMVLKKIAKLFNDNSVTWNLGASCMLYFRGIVHTFNDIDIMVSLNDVNKVKSLLNEYVLEEKIPNNNYKTKYFIEYVVDSVEIDIMAGFIIVNDGTDYYFPLENNNEDDEFILDGISLKLAKIKTWLNYYKLMNRIDKVNIILKNI